MQRGKSVKTGERRFYRRAEDSIDLTRLSHTLRAPEAGDKAGMLDM
jgi:hypothetical protein